MQDDVTDRIVDALKITLSPAEKERLADTETSKTSNVVAGALDGECKLESWPDVRPMATTLPGLPRTALETR